MQGFEYQMENYVSNYISELLLSVSFLKHLIHIKIKPENRKRLLFVMSGWMKGV